MTLICSAEKYLRDNHCRSRTLVHSCNRFTRLTGETDVSTITTEDLVRFRLETAGTLSAWTIEKTLTDVVTVLASCGREVSPGKRLRRPRPQPRPCTLDDIGSVWRGAPPWLRQWMVLAYWTAARHNDALRLQLALGPDLDDTLSLPASKTGWCHRWPVPTWLRDHLHPMPLPYGRANAHGQRMVRFGIAQAARDADVTEWLPKHLRQRSLTEWSRVNGMAGAILHGSGLGVLNHYVDPLSVLISAGDAVALPVGWRVDAIDESDALVHAYHRCDPQAQQLVLHTTRRLSRRGA